jgi:cell division protein FtsZ
VRAPAVAQQRPTQAAIDQAATAAVAAAVLPPSASEEVTFRPIPPKPSLFMEPAAPAPAVPETPAVFIPPQPERVENRGPRMPRIDELPIPAQNAIRASRGEQIEELPEKRHMTLLQRLAAVGLGRREGDTAPPAPRRRRSPATAAAAGWARASSHHCSKHNHSRHCSRSCKIVRLLRCLICQAGSAARARARAASTGAQTRR